MKSDSSRYNRNKLQLQVKKAELNELLGRSADTPYTVEEEVPLQLAHGREHLSRQVRNRNSAIRQSEMEHEDAELGLSLSRAKRYPELVMNSSYGYYREDNDVGQLLELESTGFSGGLTFRVNIFNGNRLSTEIQNSRIAVRQSERRIDKTKLAVMRKFKVAYDTYQNSLQDLDFERSSLELYQQNYDKALEDFRQGLISSTELRAAQLNLTRAMDRINDLE
ncbi:MAG: TolC family protein [Balneolaceae bacterium]|nr:TolC family protein [Balneolaceae bacterium]